MEFAITLKGDMSPKRTIAICKQAEVAGFSYTWIFDSHILWRECYPVIALCMEHTNTMRFGPCVTNPGIRDWSVAGSLFASLAEQSGGRFDIGLGRGDSSLRMLGRKPMKVATMSEFVKKIKAIVRGEKVEYKYEGRTIEVQLPWATGYELPVWVAAYGPKALKAAGETGDGLVIQLADTWLNKWFTGRVKEAGESMGRDMSNYKIMSAAPVWVGDMKKAREQTRWFPAMVGNHVADIVEKYGKDSDNIPKRFTDYIEGRKGYDYKEHADKDAEHLDFISDDIIDAFGVLGPVEEHVKKLKELEKAGVTQFNIYLMCSEEERILAEYGEHVIPHFK
ncbi:MAG: TIGR03842 family LLM class F420-dependent oxidoreductase [Candidatus Hodarchaeales archaeon]|jgi:probable F420-dependent oxidoreductase